VHSNSAVIIRSNARLSMDHCSSGWQFIMRRYTWAQMKWGGKKDREGNLCGSFDWIQDEAWITLQNWEGWLAMELPDYEKRATERQLSEP
jgi:hypothetical protein